MNSVSKIIEQSSLRTWPAVHTQNIAGWDVRISDGYSKRANSVSTLHALEYAEHTEKTATDLTLEQQISLCEQVYDKAQLPVIFKITPYTEPATLDQLLHTQGYQIQDKAIVQLKSLATIDEEYQVYQEATAELSSKLTFTIDEQWSEQWIKQASRLGEWSDSVGTSIAQLMEVNTLKKAYITVYEEDQPAACAIGIIDGEYIAIYDVITGIPYRRKGIARAMLYHLMVWAHKQGVRHAYLQVGEHNEAAITLYHHLGFQDMYRYWYRVQLNK